MQGNLALQSSMLYNQGMPVFNFSHPIEVRYGDLDPQGHVNNARFLTYIEQARLQYLVHLGLLGKGQSFLDVGIIIADVHITFLKPILFGQTVRVGLGITRLGNKSMNMDYRLFDAETNTDLALASTVLVSFDYHHNRSIAIPDSWRNTITEFENISR